jgi:hypothetical protein
MTQQGPDLAQSLLTLLTVALPPLLAGGLALALAGRTPGGRGFVRTGGGLLVLLGLVQGARELWFRFLLLPSLVETGEVPVPSAVLYVLDSGSHVLLAAALVLLLCAVLSSRGRRRAPREAVRSRRAPGPAHPPSAHARPPSGSGRRASRGGSHGGFHGDVGHGGGGSDHGGHGGGHGGGSGGGGSDHGGGSGDGGGGGGF